MVLPQVTALYTANSPYSASSQTIFAADRIHGAAVFFSKHYGFITGLMFSSQGDLEGAFHLSTGPLWALVSGAKIDGSQSDIL